MKISENLDKWNLLKNSLQFTCPSDFCIICSYFTTGKNENIRFFFFKPVIRIKLFCAQIVTTKYFALNHDKSLQFYFCVKRQEKNDFPKHDEKENSLNDECLCTRKM